MLSIVMVSAEIAGRTKDRIERLEVTADLVVKEIAKVAFFDPRKLFNGDGSLKLITEIDGQSAASIAGFEVCEPLQWDRRPKACLWFAQEGQAGRQVEEP